MASCERILTASHWGACHVVVKDGRAVGVEPFERDPSPSPMSQAMVEALYAPSRVQVPSVRRSWLEGGPGSHPERRGADPFVAVSWEEASRLVAGEIQRVRQQFGNEAIYGGSYGWSSAGRFHHAKSQLARFLSLAGGYTNSVGNYSMGAGGVLIPHVLGRQHVTRGADWEVLVRNTQLFVCFGGMAVKNAQVEVGGIGVHQSAGQIDAARAGGAEFVLVSPVAGDLPQGMGAQWLPIVPNTDTALLLALAFVLLEEDLHDRDFLARCCEGFETFQGYLRGAGDGVPKSPAWAQGITGIDAGTIRGLARRMAGRRTFINLSFSVQRCDHGEQTYWAGIALAAMLGHIGLPGGGVGFGYMAVHGMGHAVPELAVPALPVPRNPVSAFIPVARVADMLLNPGGAIHYNGQRIVYPDIRLVYWVGGNPFHHHQDINRFRAALAHAGTLVTHEPWWTPYARHCDIVLPATTTLERNDIMAARTDRFVIAMKKAVEPVGEARSDFEIFSGIAGELGFGGLLTEGRGEGEWLRRLYEQTREPNARLGIELPDFETFWRAGVFELPARAQPWDPFAAFRDDPQGNPLATPSGRVEIASSAIAGFGYEDCPGHPAWLAPAEWLGSTRARRCPLHLLSNQPATRLHSQLTMTAAGGGRQDRERGQISIHPADAALRGIAAGDTVRVHNERGAFLAIAHLTDAIRESVLLIATGAWYDPLEPGAAHTLDKNGNANVVTLDKGTSQLAQATSAQTALVEIERWSGPVPAVTAYVPPDYVEAGPR